MREEKIFTNDKCIGCNLCIASCPCEEANVAVMENGENKIYVDPEKCIVCGECVRACPHDARDYVDDTERFFADLKSGKRISVLTAPALRTNFDDSRRLLGFLRHMGADRLFDISFGADLSTWAYLRYMDVHKITGLISQPCPAIVNYIERYQPELLLKLAPVQSPVMCTAIYMRKYKKIPGSYALLSPCVAKRDEIMDEKNNQLIEYSITFRKLQEYLDRNGIDYTASTPDTFDNDQHGLGAVYPMPGGLKANLDQYVYGEWIHQVEGQPHACHFLTEYASLDQDSAIPFLVDILSCQHGCNAGTGAIRKETESFHMSRKLHTARLKAEQSAKKRIPGPDFRKLDKELDLGDFRRMYTNKSFRGSVITAGSVEAAYQALRKDTEAQRNNDCRSCGYRSCRLMAEAIAKGINHPGNCVEYIKTRFREQSEQMENLALQRDRQAHELAASVQIIFDAINESSQQTEVTLGDVRSISDRIFSMNDISQRLSRYVTGLRAEIDKYMEMGDEIVSLSKQTNLLAINASVEAVRVGQYGRGFAVVAEQIQNLSDRSERSAQEALDNNELIAPLLEQLLEISSEVLQESRIISENTDKVLEAMSTLTAFQQNIAASAAQIEQSKEVMF